MTQVRRPLRAASTAQAQRRILSARRDRGNLATHPQPPTLGQRCSDIARLSIPVAPQPAAGGFGGVEYLQVLGLPRRTAGRHVQGVGPAGGEQIGCQIVPILAPQPYQASPVAILGCGLAVQHGQHGGCGGQPGSGEVGGGRTPGRSALRCVDADDAQAVVAAVDDGVAVQDANHGDRTFAVRGLQTAWRETRPVGRPAGHKQRNKQECLAA